MDNTTIYRKTERGHSAMRERPAFLSPQLRSLLIMVDGAKPVADLLKFNGVMGDVPTGLGRLEAEGLIEATRKLVAAAAPAVPVSQPVAELANHAKASAPPVAGIGLQAFQRQATRVLLDGLGPVADSMCERLERTKTASDALVVAERCLQALVDSRRPEAAAKLRDLMAQLASG